MVNDLDDLHLVRALHRLRQLVVVHENQFAVHRLEEIRLGQDADRAAFRIRDRKHGET